jgi:hypothetical protein
MTIWRPSIFGICSTNASSCRSALDPLDLAHANILVRHFPTTKAQGHLDLVFFIEEARHVAQLDLVVVFVGTRDET